MPAETSLIRMGEQKRGCAVTAPPARRVPPPPGASSADCTTPRLRWSSVAFPFIFRHATLQYECSHGGRHSAETSGCAPHLHWPLQMGCAAPQACHEACRSFKVPAPAYQQEATTSQVGVFGGLHRPCCTWTGCLEPQTPWLTRPPRAPRRPQRQAAACSAAAGGAVVAAAAAAPGPTRLEKLADVATMLFPVWVRCPWKPSGAGA